MNVRVSDIADVQGGLVLSRKEAKNSVEEICIYRRLTLRSLNSSGYIDDSELEDFYAAGKLENALFTQADDIAVRLSYPLDPVLITENSRGLLVPSQIALLHIKDSTTIIPGYLRLYLTQKDVLGRVQQMERGTAQRTIKIGTILGLEMIVPDMETQKKLVAIDELSRRREHLYRSLIEQERFMTEELIEEIIGGMIK